MMGAQQPIGLAELAVTDLIGAIPYRIALAGGWIDQPFVSRLNPAPPGSMVVVSLEPLFPFMERCGLELGSAGTSAYLSYTNQQTDKWKGYGEQKQEQINFKIVQPIGEGRLSAFYNWSDRQENDYQDLSLEMISRLGYDWDNLSAPSEWPVMVQVAQIYQGTLPGPYPSPIATVDDSYANASGLREDDLAGITLNLPFGEAWSWDTTVYLHQNEGQGIWFTPYVPTPVGAPDGRGRTNAAGANAPISVRTTEYSIDRTGVTTALTAAFGNHTVSGGLWYEDNDFVLRMRRAGADIVRTSGIWVVHQYHGPSFPELGRREIKRLSVYFLDNLITTN